MFQVLYQPGGLVVSRGRMGLRTKDGAKRRVEIMSRFYGSIEGNRGMATRCGTAGSGMSGHLRGWNTGARVHVVDVDGKDVVRVYRTSGSNGKNSEMLLAEYGEDTPYLGANNTETVNALELAVEYCGKPFNIIDGAQAEAVKIACQKALGIIKGCAWGEICQPQ